MLTEADQYFMKHLFSHSGNAWMTLFIGDTISVLCDLDEVSVPAKSLVLSKWLLNEFFGGEESPRIQKRVLLSSSDPDRTFAVR